MPSKQGCSPSAARTGSSCTCISDNGLEAIAELNGLPHVGMDTCTLFERLCRHFGTRDPRQWPHKAGSIARRSYRPQKDPLARYLLTTRDIRRLLKQYEDQYPTFKSFGAVPLDFCDASPNVCGLSLQKDLVKHGKSRAAVVINTDPSSRPGEHWLLVWIDLSKATIAFFDSEGKEPPAQIKRFTDRLTSQCKQVSPSCKYTKVVKMRHQAANTTECGIYCIYFVEALLQGKPVEAYSGVSGRITNKQMRKFFAKELFPNQSPHVGGHVGKGRRRGGIEHLDTRTLRSLVRKKHNTVILFHAPWCGYCTQFKPAYERFAKARRKTTPVRVCAIDMDAYPDAVPDEFPLVEGFPTVMFCRADENGGKYESIVVYDGARTTAGLLDFAQHFFAHVRAAQSAGSTLSSGAKANGLVRWQRALQHARAQGGCGVCRKGTALYKKTKRIFNSEQKGRNGNLQDSK